MSGQSGSASDGWDEFLSGLKVMVVDDDPLCLKVVEQMLKKCSYTGQHTLTACMCLPPSSTRQSTYSADQLCLVMCSDYMSKWRYGIGGVAR